jgi:FKBP-type peptidyl-prolyl cis-trans isomerase (trigger factor)
MKIVITETKNNTAYIDALLNETEVSAEKEHALDELISSVNVKGFRQGKAPKSIAAEHVDPDKLSQHILSHVLNNIVRQTLNDNHFHLLGRPVLENIDSKDKNGWTIKLTFPLYPEINVSRYKQLFTTQSSTKPASKKTDSEEEKITKIYQTLLQKIKVKLPQSVIDEEVGYSLEKLENQAKTLNLTLENYYKAVKKTAEQVKTDYAQKAEESIKLDIILLEIAKLEKIDTSSADVAKIAQAGNIPTDQLPQLKNIIDRRKTIELLLKLC